MKSFMKTLCVALLAAGLLLPACEKPSADKGGEEIEAAAQELKEAEEKAAEAEEEVEEKAAEVEEAAEINEDNYIKAAFEVTCVNAHIDDPARARELKDEIYPRYGFDEASFKSAQEALEGKDTVKAALEVRMERCSKELAETLGEAPAEGKEGEEAAVVEEGKEGEEDKKAEVKKAKPVPAKVGRMKDSSISGGNFKNTTLTVNVRQDFTVSGDFRGEREGAPFLVPFEGKVDSKGALTANGERSGNSVKVSGRVSKNGVTGSVSGSVHKVNYSTTFDAK